MACCVCHIELSNIIFNQLCDLQGLQLLLLNVLQFRSLLDIPPNIDQNAFKRDLTYLRISLRFFPIIANRAIFGDVFVKRERCALKCYKVKYFGTQFKSCIIYFRRVLKSIILLIRKDINRLLELLSSFKKKNRERKMYQNLHGVTACVRTA